MLFAFPRQHHSVAHRQADVLDAWSVLHQLVESNDSPSVVVFGVENLAAPQNVIADNQSDGPYQWKCGFVIVAVVRLVGDDEDVIEWAQQSFDRLVSAS